MELNKIIAAAAFFIFIPAAVMAGVVADAYLDRTSVKSGESVTYHVDVTAEAGVNIEVPDLRREPFPGFRVVDSGLAGPDEKDGILRLSFWYKLIPEKSGELVIPPVSIGYFEQGSRMEAGTGKLYLQVADAPADDIRTIKPIAPPDKIFTRNVIISIIAIFSAAGIYFLYKWYKKRRSFRKPSLPAAAAVSPYERAMSALRELRLDSMSAPEQVREYYFRISEIYRRYLEEVHDIAALESTTVEIIKQTSEKMPPEQITEMKSFLEKTDMVKFAKYNPAKSETEDIYSMALRLVGGM